MGGKHLKNWRFRCLPRCFRSKSHVVFLTCGYRWHWFGRVFQRASCFVFSSPKSDFSIHKATTSPPYSNPFLRQNLVEGWVFIPFLARTSSPKGLIPKNPSGKLSSQFMGSTPEAKAELDKLEEKEKAEAEMTTRGTWDWTFWCSPKVPKGSRKVEFFSQGERNNVAFEDLLNQEMSWFICWGRLKTIIYLYIHILMLVQKFYGHFWVLFLGGNFDFWADFFPTFPAQHIKDDLPLPSKCSSKLANLSQTGMKWNCNFSESGSQDYGWKASQPNPNHWDFFQGNQWFSEPLIRPYFWRGGVHQP